MVTELKRRVTPVLDVDQVYHFKRDKAVDVETDFDGINNDLDLTWAASGDAGIGKTATFILPSTASAALAAVENGSNNARITLASSAAIAAAPSSTYTVTDQGGNSWRFAQDGTWDLSGVSVGDVCVTSSFTANNNGTFRVSTVDDGSDFIEVLSTDGTAEATVAGAIIFHPTNDAANTGTLVGAEIDGLTNWNSVNSPGNDGSGAITAATSANWPAGADSNESVFTLAGHRSIVPVATIDGTITIKPGTKYLLKNITSVLYIRLSEGDTENADINDIPIFVDESFVFYSDNFYTLHANGTTGVLIELE